MSTAVTRRNGFADREPFMSASRLLDAAEAWAGGDWWVIRETIAGVKGRIDALMVPVTFDAAMHNKEHGGWTDKLRLVGLEIKASRADFLRGLRDGQFDRYSESLGGLYVVTSRAVKTVEVPAGCGHLVVFDLPNDRFGYRCICRRRATFRAAHPDLDTLWRLVFLSHNRRRDEVRAERDRVERALERIGNIASERVISMLRPITDKSPTTGTTP